MNDTMLHVSSVIWAASASLAFAASLIYIRRKRAATQALLQRLQEQTRTQELVAREQAAATGSASPALGAIIAAIDA